MKFYHFIPSNEAWADNVPNPKLARDVMPDWYKKSELSYEDSDSPTGESSGLKTCNPFLDTLIAGYVLTTWTNIYVKVGPDGSLDVDWDADASSPIIMERSPKSGALMPRPAGHMPNHLVWTPKWGFKSPKGFSTLVTHPLNRWDLPFTTSAGIIDSDKFHGSGNIPFFIKEGFEGVIPTGTPIAQLIPIKRESWTGAVYNPALVDIIPSVGKQMREVVRGYYRDKFWVKKEYKMEKNDKA
jgi:hypothetical protein